MPVHHAIWRVGENPQPLIISKLASEQLLERMILTDPTILSDQWMIIGHQENTLDKVRIDLLAIAPDARSLSARSGRAGAGLRLLGG